MYVQSRFWVPPLVSPYPPCGSGLGWEVVVYAVCSWCPPSPVVWVRVGTGLHLLAVRGIYIYIIAGTVASK